MMIMSVEPSFSPPAYYSFSLVLIIPAISLYLLLFLLRKTNTKNLPPGTTGWPILGEAMSYTFYGSQKFIQDRMESFPSVQVIRTSLYGKPMAIFCGPQANKFLFANENKLVSSWLPPSRRKLLHSPEYIEFLDSSSKIKQAPSSTSFDYHEFLKTEALKQHIPVMDSVARQQMDRDWAPNTVVKVAHLSTMYTVMLSCRLFLGVVDHKEMQELANSFEHMTSGMIAIPINFPGTSYNRGIKGGKVVRETIMRIIKERRKELMETKAVEGRDLLSKMLLAADPSEMVIRNVMVGLLLGSVDSTSSTLISVMNYLASLPHIYEQVLKEQMKIAEAKDPDDLLTLEDIQKMKFSWNMIRESLRLMTPIPGAFKETMAGFTYTGFTIPKGWKTFWSVHTTHKNPKYFPEPDKFDPSRFEGTGPAPYTFVPFGGGPRMCPGREFAKLEILVYIHNVVRRFKLEKAIPDEKTVLKYYKPSPVYGLPVRLHPHENKVL